MATLAFAPAAGRGEARFFFVMSALMAVTIVAGFSLNVLAGRSSFNAPLLFHLHALVMMGWLAIQVMQSSLIFAGNIALHRRLGWVAVVWVPLVVLTGILMIRASLQTSGGPFFFDQNQFLISNPLLMLAFAGMVTWAVAVRSETGWHRRLMYCAMAMLLGPGVGRLLPMPLLVEYGPWYLSAILPPLLFIGIGILADRRRYGRAHPAWFWGLGVVVAVQILADLIAYSPIGYDLTRWVVEGTPGATRPIEAYLPPMM